MKLEAILIKDVAAKLEESLEEGSEVYEVITSEGETKYVVATEEEVVGTPYEASESATAEEFEEVIAELEKNIEEVSEEELTGAELKAYQEVKVFLTEMKKALEGKTIVSAHNIFYGSFIDDAYVINSNQSELKEAVEVTLNIPETLTKVKEGYTRKYSVIRLHEIEKEDGSYSYEVAKLDAKDNGDGTVAFETDKFSVYVLAYEDVQNTTSTSNPDTGDNALTYLVISIISVVGLMLITLRTTRKSN